MREGLSGRGPAVPARTVSRPELKHDEDSLVSIVLLLKDRFEYTTRWLDFASLSHFPFRIVIADGSEGSEVDRMFSNGSPYPNLDIEYVRYPADRTRRDFYAKTSDAMARVATPYLIKAANDDFFSVEGIRKSVAFLETHPEHAAARGRIGDFSLDPRGMSGEDALIYGRINRWATFKPGEKSNVHPLARNRVASQCAFYITCWHDVQRTPDAMTREAMLLECGTADVRIADHVTDFLTVASGQVFRGPYPYMFRQSNPRSSAGQEMLAQFSRQADWIASPSWQQDTGCLYDSVGKVIAQRDGVDFESARASFEKAYVGVCVADLLDSGQHTPHSFKDTLKRWIRKIADALPMLRPVRRRLAEYAAQARHRQADKTLVALGWKDEAEPVVRFLASRGSLEVQDS